MNIDLSVTGNIHPAIGLLENVSIYEMDDLGALARQGVRGRERELTACHQIIGARVAALTEKLLTEDAENPWRSAPRQLSSAVLIPQPA